MQKAVIRVETATNKNGKPYQRAVFDDNKNQPLFGDLAKKITCPGQYELTYDQNVMPWKLLDAKPVVIDYSDNYAESAPVNKTKTSDMVSCAALNAASGIIVARLQMQNNFSMDEVITYVPRLVQALREGLLDAQEATEEDGTLE